MTGHLRLSGSQARAIAEALADGLVQRGLLSRSDAGADNAHPRCERGGPHALASLGACAVTRSSGRSARSGVGSFNPSGGTKRGHEPAQRHVQHLAVDVPDVPHRSHAQQPDYAARVAAATARQPACRLDHAREMTPRPAPRLGLHRAANAGPFDVA